MNVVWRAFELRPEPVPLLDPRGEYLERVWAQSVLPLAEKLGVPMKKPGFQTRSRRAHEASHWARQQGRFDAYNEAVFRAFFERGEDIGSVDVLVALAEGIGCDGAALRQSLDRNDCRDSVRADEEAAAAIGIDGVPAFIASRAAAVSGVQTVDGLRQLLSQAAVARR